MPEAPAYRVLELCKNRAGHEAVPVGRLALDLGDVERRAVSAGFDSLANAGVILVLKWGGVEMSVFESGKLLFKTKDAKAAEATMRAFGEAMGWVRGA